MYIDRHAIHNELRLVEDWRQCGDTSRFKYRIMKQVSVIPLMLNRVFFNLKGSLVKRISNQVRQYHSEYEYIGSTCV